MRWTPPPYPDNPRDLHPDCQLAREYVALLAEQRDRHVPEPAHLVRLRADVDRWQAVMDDPQSSALAYTDAQRQLARWQPELERMDKTQADLERAAAQDRLHVSLRWAQRWEDYLRLLARLREAAAVAFAEERESKYQHRGRDHRAALTREVEALVGPASLYLPVEDLANAHA